MKPALSTRALNKVVAIAQGTTDKYRKELDKNIHVADISFGALKQSVSTLDEYEHYVLLDAFNAAASFRSTSLHNAIKQVKSDTWKGLVYVSDAVYGDFLIAVSYKALQQYSSKILKAISSSFPNLSPLLGQDPSGKTLARVGHIADSFSHANTPLLEKLKDIYKRLPQVASNKVISQALSLQSVHTFDVEYNFNREDVSANLSSILGRGTILVTIQSDARNSALAKIEAEINRNVINYLTSEEFKSDVLVEPGSNTILEDIDWVMRKALDPKLKQPEKHRKKPTAKKSAKVKDTAKVLPLAAPRLELPAQTNLTSLQNLINRQLQDVISANMGDGDSRSVLNYRTGRLAGSARVERLTQSRSGMITAFYSYMKNPYATFSEGGQQPNPRSRDPKLLISRSIREIAATKVANQLRAVNV
jgi:hypothetical protein